MISIWEKETFFAPYDIVIVGSGFVGLWSAFHLLKKKPQLNICIVDRGVIPTGASTRNAGFACFGSLSELVYDAKKMGVDQMLQLVEMRYKGIDRIKKFFAKAEIDFDMCGGYELYNQNDGIGKKQIEENIAYLNTLLKPISGSKQTFKLDDDRLPRFGFGATKHLVKNNLEGYLHSGKLLKALLLRVQSMGATIFNQTEIAGFTPLHDRIEIHTNHHFQLKAKQVLICTNAFAKQLVPELDIVPARGQVLLTSPIKNLPWKGTFHSDEGFYYFRNLGDRILLGGARNKAFNEEETFEMVTSDFVQKELERYLNEVILPDQQEHYTIDYRWSGIMAMGREKSPIVKELKPNLYCAVRMSGMGVALAPVIGQTISKMML